MRDTKLWRREGSHFLPPIKIELAQLFEFDRCTTMVCAVLCSWHTHASNENERAGRLNDEPWAYLSKTQIRQSCLGWVSIKKIDDAIENMEQAGVLKIDRSRTDSDKGRLGYLVLMDVLNSKLQSLPDSDDVPAPAARMEFGKNAELVQEVEFGKNADPVRQNYTTSSAKMPIPYKEEKNSKGTDKNHTPLPPFSEPESEPLPEPPAGVDLEDVLILHRRAKGSKKPSAPDLRATTEWMADLGAEPGEMYAAMQAFLEDDYWREQKYPISAFRKHYSKYCQIAQERPVAPPPPATIADLPIVPQRRSQPAKPLIPGATPDDTDAFIAEWNAGPCEALRVRVVSIELRQALRSSLSNPKFRENWATLLQKAHTLRAQPGKEWLTLSLLLKGEKWARLLNGDYDWSPNAKPAPGAGTDALDRLIAASQQKAKAKEKTDRANN